MSREIKVKSVLNKTKKRDDWFLDDYTINLYSSCSFNCLYCYIRGSKYGTNLEKSVSAKINALEILEKQLYTQYKKRQFGVIVLSSATDPYLPLEENYQLTRGALELIHRYKFPVHIITKSNLIERDFNLLEKIDREAILPQDLKEKLGRGTIITFSFSTLDNKVARLFEPGAPSPDLRLNTLKKTQNAGFLSGVSLMPLLPFISDTTAQLDLLFTSFQHCADYVLPATLTLFGQSKSDSKTLITKTIEKHYPELKDRYQKYFKYNSQLPQYYQTAFKHKMLDLSLQYNMPNDILTAAIIKKQAQQ